MIQIAQLEIQLDRPGREQVVQRVGRRDAQGSSKADNACLAIKAAAEPTLKTRSIDFTRSLPEAMRLPATSAESIRQDHKSRHKQSKLGQYFVKRLSPVHP